MTEQMKEQERPDLAAARRRVGRPTTLESGGASLAKILTLVRNGVATTRLAIERESELGRAVVADRLSTLERLGLIAEGELGPAIGGRAPRHVRFCADAGAVLVAHVDGTSLAVALADLSGNLIVEHHEAADLAIGPEPLLDRRGGKQRAWAIAISLPEVALVDSNDSGAFDIAALDVLRAWRKFDFATELSLRFSAPCWV